MSISRCGFLVLSALVMLNGCAAPLLIGGAAATGVAVANDRRTAGTIVDDEGIELQILSLVAKEQDLVERSHLNVTSYNGVVLLTGEVEEKALSKRITDLARQTAKVRMIKNELHIGPLSSTASRSNDTVITTRVKSRLIADPGVDGTAIKVISEDGTVYLMGLVSPAEADSAVEITRHTEGVQRIVKVFEYIR